MPVACKSKMVRQDVSEAIVWVCQDVGVAMDKMFAFLFYFISTATFLDLTF